MRKLFGLISAVTILSAMGASAQAEIFISASHTLTESGNVNHNIFVRANLEQPKSNSMIVVKDASGNITEINQGYADNNGAISFEFPCNDAGVYSGYVNTENGRVKEQFQFEILSDYQSLVDEFKDATPETMADLIEANKAVLLFDTKYYTDKTMAEIAGRMFENKDKLDISNITETFDKSVITEYVYGDYPFEKKQEIMAYYDSTYLGVISQTYPENIYSDFLGFDEEYRTKVFALIEKKNPELDEFADTFNEAVVMTAYNYFEAEELDKFFLNNPDYVEFENYSSYTPTKRKNIILGLKKLLISDMSDLLQGYDTVINDNGTNNPGTDSGNSRPGTGNTVGGGGGGGGGGSRPSSTTVTVPNQEQYKPDTGAVQGDSNVENQVGQQAAAERFNDIEGVLWAKPAIEGLYQKGIIKGRGNNEFAPNDNVSRAEFAVMITNAFIGIDSSASCEFSDVPAEDWAYPYVATLYSKGVIYGMSETEFGKNNNITREEMAAILHRVLSFTKSLPNLENISNSITDFDDVSEYARNSVLMLSELKVINGVGDGYFMPKKNATRAESAVIISNALEVVEK